MKQSVIGMWGAVAVVNLLVTATVAAEELPDISSVATDLRVPDVTEEPPAAGRRVKMVLPAYQNSEVHHLVYLPVDWNPDRSWPVIVEYAGNGPFQNRYGDVCTGRVEDCSLGYGISGGQGFIWVCLPYVSADHLHNQRQWWGDLEATVQYCKTAVPQICDQFAGDRHRVVLTGFSRGAIACNMLGLHDDEVASLWAAFICHSHYDGVRQWPYAGSDRQSAMVRLQRLKGRPQFISHESSVDATKSYLQQVAPDGNFTFQTIPFRNHTDSWVLRDLPERRKLRAWLTDVLK